MSLTELPGVRLGHWTDAVARTGCTVALFDPAGATVGVSVRGGAPGTRETDLLAPGNLVERVHAIVLAGGSAFGLAAADGVVAHLAERGIGLEVGSIRVPIVPAAVIFDLAVGSSSIFPDAAAGRAACLDAERGPAIAEGRVGAGTGATVAKLLGRERALPGGLGAATVRLPSGAVVGALAVVNAAGDVVGRDGRLLAGVGAWRALLETGAGVRADGAASTTLGLVATDVRLDRPQCRRLAEVAHDALALAIRPIHTLYDGDTVFAASTGHAEADPTSLGVAAVEALRTAIERAVG